MAQVVDHYSAHGGLLDSSQSWRWDGARWVRPDESEPIDSIAESVEEQQLGSETLDPLIAAQHLAQLGHPDVHSFQSKERLPASRLQPFVVDAYVGNALSPDANGVLARRVGQLIQA